MQILKETGINWRDRSFISKLYKDKSVKVRLDLREARRIKTGRGVKTSILYVTSSLSLVQRIGRQLFRAVKYVDDFCYWLKKT
jgi:hypothetical protein